MQMKMILLAQSTGVQLKGKTDSDLFFHLDPDLLLKLYFELQSINKMYFDLQTQIWLPGL